VLWVTYEPIYIVYAGQVRETVVSSIEESASAFEFKMFFFNKLAHSLTAQQLSRIFKAIRMRLTHADQDTLQYQRNNLNPIRNGMQIIAVLNTILALKHRDKEQIE
jgi:hypothetical protein